MANIHQLDRHMIDKIAAGEVVERPASVVKELVENSLDAGSSSITVEIKNGGLSYIRVTDNGAGMDDTDTKLCFKPHATSKILNENDLFSIATLGFRGEALPSICEVSKVSLSTRQKNTETAIFIENHGGKIIDEKTTGKPEGTTIIVEDLFFNVPARLKFSKKAASEAALISNIILQYILAKPSVSFRLINNGKDVYKSIGDGNLLNAVYSVYGRETSDHMIEISYEYDGIKIYGLIGDSQLVRSSKNNQSLFVNGRYIKNDEIANSIKLGYQNRIMPVKFPVFIMNLTVPLDEVDVNVHPNKLEVRFQRIELIKECFYKAVRSTLDKFYTTIKQETKSFAFEEPKPISMPTVAPPIFEQPKIDYQEKINESVSNIFAADKIKSNDYPVLEEQTVMPMLEKVVQKAKEPEPEVQQIVLMPDDDVSDYRVIGQLFLTYILIEYKDNFLMIDQHAARERINTNLLVDQLEQQNVSYQSLLVPILIKLTAQEHTTILENIEFFETLGFSLSDFGDNSLKIDAIPSILGEPHLQDFFLEAVDNLGELKQGKVELKKSKLFQTACKHSIKGGEKLSPEQIKYLISETMIHKTPLHCPHGRPIVIIKTKTEIEKMFGRIV